MYNRIDGHVLAYLDEDGRNEPAMSVLDCASFHKNSRNFGYVEGDKLKDNNITPSLIPADCTGLP
jgi:hypothetical protein